MWMSIYDTLESWKVVVDHRKLIVILFSEEFFLLIIFDLCQHN